MEVCHSGRVTSVSPDQGSHLSIPLIIEEHHNLRRIREPVSVGIPFPIGRVKDVRDLGVLNQGGKRVSSQIQILSTWPDGSVQWGLVEFFADVEPYGQCNYWLENKPKGDDEPGGESVKVEYQGEELLVDTGKFKFFMNPSILTPFTRVEGASGPFLVDGMSQLVLTDDKGEKIYPHISNLSIETAGPVRTTIIGEGTFAVDRTILARVFGQFHFYSDSGLVDINLTICNERAAQHPGGLWDLGDQGSVYFSDLSLSLGLITAGNNTKYLTSQALGPMVQHKCGHLEIYQDSSGGENWNSSNHVNRHGEIPLTFSGYQVSKNGSLIEEGKRASPVVRLEEDGKILMGAIPLFWQNFPKGLAIDDHVLSFQLFPKRFGDLYELQGGEQKTHKMVLQFSSREDNTPDLNWVHGRLIPVSTPEWYSESQAVPYLSPRKIDPNTEYCSLIDTIVDGPKSFFLRREIIDEYGWRNFGEVYADHEAVGHEGNSPRVSHYNNQYDVVYGLFIEYLRTGDNRWFSLMSDLARHVIDIDIYHTLEDRDAYNGGMFWHTDHYCDAETGTHRTYSRVNQEAVKQNEYGGGPSNEHNYTSGLLHYYYLTGDILARRAVEGLADWVQKMDRGLGGLIGWLDPRPKGAASSTVHRDYHGPGRGAANSINALVDGCRLTNDEALLQKAEELIRRCIHPGDSVQERKFSDVENRWSYTVFLQTLGKYLDFKVDRQEQDEMYAYAKACLVHYATWMAQHERPYVQVFHRVKRPTETWPAQDMRKSNVFKFAAKYGDDSQRSMFLERAEYFFRSSINDLLTFETCYLTRPRVLVLVNGYMHSYFQSHPGEKAPWRGQTIEFNRPREFTPQLNQLYIVKDFVNSILSLVKR